MSILAIQRRHAEMYRIRLGKRDGKTPSRLIGEIRVTSKSRNIVSAFAEVYGGRPKRWPEGNGHEVYLPTDRLPIAILPGQNLTQSMELWTGSVCARRCDSVTMQDGKPCACGPDLPIKDRECKPVSRLTVACPDVPVVGVGLLTTRSEIAAGELDGMFSIIQPMLDSGRSVNAILRVDQMTGAGKQYAVPRLELEGVSFQDIALAASSAPELGSGVPVPVAIGRGEHTKEN